MDTKRFSLNMADLSVLGRNALLVGSAAALTYVAGNLGDLDFGNLGALIVPIVAVALDSAIKWLKDNTNKPVDPPA